MFCSNCGKELIKGARYCPYCGCKQEVVEPQADQQPQQEQPQQEQQWQPVPPDQPDQRKWEQQWQPAPAPKKTGKGMGVFIAILVIVIFAVAARFAYGVVAKRFLESRTDRTSSVSIEESTSAAGAEQEGEAEQTAAGAGQKDETEPEADTAEQATDETQEEEKSAAPGSLRDRLSKELAGKDLLIEHDTVQYGGDDGTISFVTAFYGDKTRYLKALTVEYLFSKEAGYTMESIQDSDFTPFFPDFAEFSYLENDEYVAFISEMRDIDCNERIVKLAEVGIIEQGEDAPEEAEVLDADYLMDSFRDQGWSELDPAYESLMDFSY